MNTPGLETPGEVRWRVGHISDPIGFIPRERCSWNNRFDDSKQRFRTLYCAIRPETALREVLADLRRNTDEMARYAHDEPGCAGIRSPSRLDGLPCYALFEGRARLEAIDPPIPLIDPPPPALEHVAAEWGLLLQPAPTLATAPKKAP